ncbi:hypothetical protein FAI40_04740 [Acetobacteraceae bacterium]|nr:hypothetical protein FAI40_04740 [Acetobacteraceae bacterium]
MTSEITSPTDLNKISKQIDDLLKKGPSGIESANKIIESLAEFKKTINSFLNDAQKRYLDTTRLRNLSNDFHIDIKILYGAEEVSKSNGGKSEDAEKFLVNLQKIYNEKPEKIAELQHALNISTPLVDSKNHLLPNVLETLQNALKHQDERGKARIFELINVDYSNGLRHALLSSDDISKAINGFQNDIPTAKELNDNASSLKTSTRYESAMGLVFQKELNVLRPALDSFEEGFRELAQAHPQAVANGFLAIAGAVLALKGAGIIQMGKDLKDSFKELKKYLDTKRTKPPKNDKGGKSKTETEETPESEVKKDTPSPDEEGKPDASKEKPSAKNTAPETKETPTKEKVSAENEADKAKGTDSKVAEGQADQSTVPKDESASTPEETTENKAGETQASESNPPKEKAPTQIEDRADKTPPHESPNESISRGEMPNLYKGGIPMKVTLPIGLAAGVAAEAPAVLAAGEGTAVATIASEAAGGTLLAAEGFTALETAAGLGLGVLGGGFLGPLLLGGALGVGTYYAVSKGYEYYKDRHKKSLEKQAEASALPAPEVPTQSFQESLHAATHWQDQEMIEAIAEKQLRRKTVNGQYNLEQIAKEGPLTEIRTGDINIYEAHTNDPHAFAHEVEQVITDALNRTSRIFNPNIAI